MYNDRNRQNCNCARQNPPALRLGADIPRLDADQGGRRCDGSLGRAQCDRGNNRGRGSDGLHDRPLCERNACDLSPRDRADKGNGWALHDHPLAMVYSPYQHFRDTYTPDIALDRGTLFAELDLPFEGYHNKRNGGCTR